METRLQDILWENEEVRWTGRPKPFPLMGTDSKKEILITWVISAAVLLLMILFLIPPLIQGTRPLAETLILFCVAMFVPGILSVRPFLDKKCLEQNTLYAITNDRVIALVKDDTLYLPLNENTKTSIEHRDGSCGNLCFGETIGKPPHKSRSLTVLGMRDEESRYLMRGLMFYHVDQPEQIAGYVS